MSKKVFVVVAIILVVGAIGCTPVAKPAVVTVVGASSTPVIPTEAPTATRTLTMTPEPTTTPTLMPSFTEVPTVTNTPTPQRKWDLLAVNKFYMFVGGWFLGKESYPPVPREGDSIAQLFDEFVWDPVTHTRYGPIEKVNPDLVCEWALERLEEGYSLTIIFNGEVWDKKTREDRWYQFSTAVGDPNTEPYCPQFDPDLGVHEFGELEGVKE